MKIPSLAVIGLVSGQAMAADGPAFRVHPGAEAVMERYCFSCHEDGTTKGDVQLDNIGSLPLDARLDLLNRMKEQVFTGEMPPKKKKQPTDEEKDLLMDWVSGELRQHNASKLDEKLRMPDYGNVIDHDKLFSGKYKDLPAYTPDRRWLISEFIFDAKFNRLLEQNGLRDIDGKRRPVIGDNNRSKINLTNPFLLPTNSGVRYYDTTTLDGGHLLTMIANGKELSPVLINNTRARKNIPAINAIMAAEWADENTLTARETYLNANIETLLSELYGQKNQSMMPKFIPVKRDPPAPTVSPDGKPQKKSVFDTVKPGNDDMAEIFATIQKHVGNGLKDDALILECEKDWFILGLDERDIQLRVKLMQGYMEDLLKRLPKPSAPKATKPPIETELAAIRAAILKHRKAGDTYTLIVTKCMADWRESFKQEREKTGGPSESLTSDLVDQLFTKIIERSPTSQEKAEYLSLVKSWLAELGNQPTIEKLIQTLILRSDFVYRQEFGQGETDAQGRKMLSPHDASFALAYALTDSSPDKELLDAAKNGKLTTRDDYRREVERMLKKRDQYYIIDEAVERVGGNDSFTNIPIRKLRFFREFFGYPALLSIFKDNKRFGGDYTNASGRLVSEADMLVEHILDQDCNVFERLLSTEDFYVYHSGDNKKMSESVERIRKIYEYFKGKDWQNFDTDQLKSHAAFLKENPVRGVPVEAIGEKVGRNDTLKTFKTGLASYTERLSKGQTAAVPFPAYSSHDMTEAQTRSGKHLNGAEVAKCFNLDLVNWNYPANQPAKMEHRKGILTHPAWLIAFAANTATDPVRRGKWVRQKLLAGTVPDTPVTVDAVIPEDHQATLRSRLAKVTEVEYCWKCHERMNPLGNAFEMYDDFGRYRIEEFLEHPDNLVKKNPDKGPPQEDLRDIYKTLPVETKGHLAGTGDPKLDGDVSDAIDLMSRLSKSTKVRQSIIRHAFRYFMGRNEVLSDSKTLIDADQAYVQSGGSFDAVIVSLLTSDSFIYRKAVTQ